MEIKKIVVLVETEKGAVHQVRASEPQKQIALKMLVGENGVLNVTEEIAPIEFKFIPSNNG